MVDEGLLAELVKMIESRLGAAFAQVVVVVIGLAFFLAAIYYSMYYLQKISQKVSGPISRALTLPRGLRVPKTATQWTEKAIGPLRTSDFVFIILFVVFSALLVFATTFTIGPRWNTSVVELLAVYSLLVVFRSFRAQQQDFVKSSVTRLPNAGGTEQATLKITKVIRYPDRVALEYELVEPVVDGYQPHHPQTFPPLASDDRCTWDNLRLLLPATAEWPSEETRTDCVVLAVLLLEREVKAQESAAAADADLLALANQVVAPEAPK